MWRQKWETCEYSITNNFNTSIKHEITSKLRIGQHVYNPAHCQPCFDGRVNVDKALN